MPCENCVQFKFVSIKTFFGTQLYLVICYLWLLLCHRGKVQSMQRLFGLKILIYFWHFTEKSLSNPGFYQHYSFADESSRREEGKCYKQLLETSNIVLHLL